MSFLREKMLWNIVTRYKLLMDKEFTTLQLIKKILHTNGLTMQPFFKIPSAKIDVNQPFYTLF